MGYVLNGEELEVDDDGFLLEAEAPALGVGLTAIVGEEGCALTERCG